MQCQTPIVVKVGEPKFYEYVPCGKCGICLQNRRNSWAIRLRFEAKDHLFSHFITLTYSDDTIPINHDDLYTLDKRDCQKFLKRLRKRLGDDKIRYFLCGEYGSNTHRPHYHAIIFGLDPTKYDIPTLIHESWQLGHVHVGTVTEKSIMYVTKYCVKSTDDVADSREPVFCLMSRRPGLGSNYLLTHKEWHTSDDNRHYLVLPGGYKHSLPRYYSDKIFTYTLGKKVRYGKYKQRKEEDTLAQISQFDSKYPTENFYEKEKESIVNTNELIFKRINKNDKF